MDLVSDQAEQPITLYKRWFLRDSISVDDVKTFVEQRIVPAYRRLSSDVELGLEVETLVDGSDTHIEAGITSIVAVQRWTSTIAHDTATTGTAYARWWADYEPILSDWDRLVSFANEWTTTPVSLRDATDT